MEANYINKMKIMAEENNQNTKTKLDEIDKQMKMRIVSFVAAQSKAWRDLNKSVEDKHHVCLEKERLEVRDSTHHSPVTLKEKKQICRTQELNLSIK